MTTLTPPLKWHGGKSGKMADWIVSLMPPRCATTNTAEQHPESEVPGYTHYVEPYAGGLNVLLRNDPEGISEVANDLDGDLMNFWQVLRDELAEFDRRLECTPFGKPIYDEAVAHLHDGDAVERAVNFFVFCRQSLSGRMAGFTSITRRRTRRGMNAETSAWMNAIDGLPAVSERLRRVVIFNKPAFEVIRSEDTDRTLFYLDPPYLHETRTSTQVYGGGKYEMSELNHRQMLTVIVEEVKGKVMLSGYRSELYDERLASWTCHEIERANSAAGGKTKRTMTECVWTNY